VNRSIRLRIAFAVFAVVVTLVAAQIVYVMSRFEHSFVEEIDDRLEEGLGDLRVVLRADHVDEWIAETAGEHQHEDELFVEIRDRSNRLVARSSNVPETGFPGSLGVEQPPTYRYWNFAHPRSRTGSRQVRALETWIGDSHVAIGISLEEVQRWYRGLRKNLVTSLVAIALLGALSAYGVAAHALRPVAKMAERARSLSGSPDGELLPRTGSGDEIDRLAGVLNDLLSRIRAEVLRVRRLTADAAHALRTPLTAIRGHLELDAARTEGASEPVAVAIEQVDDLVRFVNRLLLLEKLESGRDESLARERIDLLAEAQGLVDHLGVLASERDVSVECRGDSAQVDVDRTQVRQAILNLLDNALRHTPAGGKVAVEVTRRGANAELAVCDDGQGLPAEQLERVFERFYSTRAGTGAGTGLGLPIARAIARSHGGDVTATSSAAGARFVLRLPLAT